MSYHQGFLYLTDRYGNPIEVVNEFRTRARIRAAIAAGTKRYGPPDAAGECSALGFEPCAMASNGAVTAWNALNTAINASPWWTATAGDDSSEALGFFIEEWTGLDGGHVTRSLTPRGNYPQGGFAGLQSQGARVMAINLIAVGTSERGLQHLFRWLESTLAATCDPYETQSLWLREFCPAGTTATQLEDGLVRLDEVVMAAGPTWIEPPVADAGGFLRRLSFTLTAADPCMKRVPSAAQSNTATYAVVGSATPQGPAGCSAYEGSTQRHTVAISAPAYGSASASIRIWSNPLLTGATYHYLPALRIVGHQDSDGFGAFRPCSQPRRGLLTLDQIPSGWELSIDCSTAKVLARDLARDREWSDGSVFVQANADYDGSYEGGRRINFERCSNGYITVEPALAGTSTVYSSPYMSGWNTEITPTSKFGCI